MNYFQQQQQQTIMYKRKPIVNETKRENINN